MEFSLALGLILFLVLILASGFWIGFSLLAVGLVTAMLLNYSLLHRVSEPAERPNDPRFFALLEAAHDRIAAPHGLASKSQSGAERLFRKSLKAE